MRITWFAHMRGYHKFINLLAIVSLSACVTTTPSSNLNIYHNCDGYRPPSLVHDGVSPTNMFQPKRQRPITFETDASPSVQDCHQALTHLEHHYPQYVLRQVSLLQARAIHYLIADQIEPAMTDLDVAEHILPSDNIYFLRSFGLNTALIRTLALSLNGQQEEADQLALELHNIRPYSHHTTYGTLIALGPSAGEILRARLLEQLARLYPRQSRYLYLQLFETGHYRQSLELVPLLKPPKPAYTTTQDLRTRLQRREQVRADHALFWTDMNGRKAYAHASLGDTTSALQTLEAARESLDKAIKTPKGQSKETTLEAQTQQVVLEQINLEIKSQAIPLLQFWTQLTQAQIARQAGALTEAQSLLQSLNKVGDSLVPLKLAGELDPLGYGQPEGESIWQSAHLQAIAVGLPPQDPKVLFNFLFDLESHLYNQQLARNSSYTTCASSQQHAVPYRPTFELCTRTKDANPQIIEELALLSAAYLTGQQNKASLFLIDNRQVTQYQHLEPQTNTIHQDSIQIRLLLHPVSYTQTPPCWRCLNIENIGAHLAPIYPKLGTGSP